MAPSQPAGGHAKPHLTAHRLFQADLVSTRAARRYAARLLGSWGFRGDVVDQALLLATELVTNAVLHARTEFELRLLLYEPCMRIDVFDLNTRLPVLALAPNDATSGRGLLIVNVVASSWGAEAQGEGKVVWAELDNGGSPRGGRRSSDRAPGRRFWRPTHVGLLAISATQCRRSRGR